MASKLALLLTFFCFASATATRFKVGGNAGWFEPGENNTALYSEWAAKSRFVVGDSLYFEYRNDSVLVVDKAGYYHCNTTNPIATFSDGKTVIKLDRPGLSYFISGTPHHCNKGQRLNVNVMTAHHTPPSPDSPPPQPYQTVSPAPSPDGPSSSGVSLSVNAGSCASILVGLAMAFAVPYY